MIARVAAGHDDLLDLAADPLRHPARARRRRLGQDDQELVAAVAAAQIAPAQHLAQAMADRREHFVSRQMAVIVVDLLELIDVEHHDRERGAAAARAGQLGFERVETVGAVEAAGQRVAQAVIADLGEELHVAQRDAEQRRRRPDRAADFRSDAGRGDADHAGHLAADRDDVAEEAVLLHAVRALEPLGRRLQDGVGHRFNLSAAPPRLRAIGHALPFGIAADQHPDVGVRGERRQMAPDRFVQRVDGQRPAQRLPERHQGFELAGPGARGAGFARGRRGLGSHLAAVPVQVEHEHDAEDQQRRNQRDAIGALDVAGDVEQELERSLKDHQQRKGKTRQKQGVVPPGNA